MESVVRLRGVHFHQSCGSNHNRRTSDDSQYTVELVVVLERADENSHFSNKTT